MKLWTLITSSAVLLLTFSGCGLTSPKPGKEVTVDETLAIVTLTKNGTFVDMNAIAFEWKAIEDERVRGIHVYKQDMTNNKEESEVQHHKTIQNRFATHYVDTDVTPDSSYTYSFKTYSKDAESKMSSAVVLNSLPVLQSVSWIKSIQNMPRSAKIIWRPHSNEKVEFYSIERRTLQDNKFEEIATVENRVNAEYIDEDLKDNFVYKYRVRVVTFDGIISSPSEIVQVVTKSLPKSIINIKTTTNLPKKIKITWDKSDTEDFSRYYLYRSEESDGSYELIAKLHNNVFIDIIEEDAKEYFYRVSAIEKYGLQSVHDRLSIQGLTLIKPKAPDLKSVRLINSRVEIRWNSRDERAVKYIVEKKIKKGWFDATKEEFTDIKGEIFIDSEVGPNTIYHYKVFAIDKFGIKSLASIDAELKTPKSLADNSRKPITKEAKSQAGIASVAKNPDLEVKEVEIIPLNDFN